MFPRNRKTVAIIEKWARQRRAANFAIARPDVGHDTGMDATHRRDSAENFGGRNELPANGRQSCNAVSIVRLISRDRRLRSCGNRGKARYA